MPTLAKRLVVLRKEYKKTQQQVADYLKITRPAYTAYESGNRQPDYSTLQKLADYFDTTTDYLLGRTDKIDGTSGQGNQNEEINTAFHDFDNLTEEEKEHLELQLQIYRELKKRKLSKDRNKEK